MARLWKTETPNRTNPLICDLTYFVEVCGFTFEFNSLEQIEQYRAYYARKIHPSSADYCEDAALDHWERQSRFDELPLYLREEPKRLRVVKALERASKQWAPTAN